MIAIKNVLVATDFSPSSDTALVYGRALARTFGGTLHLMHVVDDLSVRLTYAEAAAAGGLGTIALQEEVERAGRQELERWVSDSDRGDLHAVTVLKVSNSVAKEITEYAKHRSIDVIVVGATGRGAIDRMLMGSVADKVIRRAPCPVLTVRNPEHEFVVPDALQVVTRVKV